MSYMISTDPSVSSAHVEFDDMLPSTVGRTDETTKSVGDVGRSKGEREHEWSYQAQDGQELKENFLESHGVKV
jgi:hypothetical protein